VEALLVVVAEVAAVLVLAGSLVAAASLLGATVGLITALAGLRLPTQPRLRRLRGGLALALVLAAGSLVALQTVALRPALGWLLAGLGEARGYTVEIGAADLALLRGGLALGDLRVRKGDGVDLRVDHLELDLDWSSIVSARLKLQDLEIRGVLGRYADTTDAEPRPPSRRRPFAAARVAVDDVDVVIASAVDPLGHHLRIDTFEVAPLRSDHPLYDLLLASRGRLWVDDLFVEIDRDATRTRWSVAGVPAAAISHRLGGPLTWLSAGALDLELELRTTTTPTSQGPRDADLRLRLRLRDARVSPPKELPLAKRLAVKGLDLALRAAEPLTLELDLPLRADDFAGALTLADAGLESALTRALADAVIRRARLREDAP
jgi:hypothetical protein